MKNFIHLLFITIYTVSSIDIYSMKRKLKYNNHVEESPISSTYHANLMLLPVELRQMIVYYVILSQLKEKLDLFFENNKGDVVTLINSLQSYFCLEPTVSDKNFLNFMNQLRSTSQDFKRIIDDQTFHLGIQKAFKSIMQCYITKYDVLKFMKKDFGGESLHQALCRNFITLLELLLADEEIDINTKNGTGALLHIAIWHTKSIKLVLLLLSYGKIEVNAKDVYNNTPLIFAVNENSPELVRILLDNKADINAKNLNGQTPLYIAVVRGYKDIVKLLLAHNEIDVNVKNNGGNTALHIACKSPRLIHRAIVRLLLAHKNIDVNVKNDAGETPEINFCITF